MTKRGLPLAFCAAAAITLAPSWLRAQAAAKPVVFPGGVVNAASFRAASQPGYGISKGSIAAIFGTNLAGAEASAPSVPLPTQLGGTSVTFDGIPAPLFYVSPGQINAQVPNKASNRPTVVVTTTAGSSDPVSTGGSGSLGLFTANGTGCGQGAILNVAQDGALSLNTPQNSAAPGSYVAVYGTGLPSDYLYPALPDGAPAPSDPPISYSERPGVYVRDQVAWLGIVSAYRAPTLVGVDQYNVQLSADVPQGCQLPLRVADPYWTSSQPVLVSIHEGGGTCVPNVQSAGVLRWEKVVTSDTGGTTTTETLLVDLTAGDGESAPQPLTPQPGENRALFTMAPGPSCPDAEDKTLDAGMLVAYGPTGGANLRITPALSDGKLVYTQALPPGTIGPGTYGVVALGGRDVGRFGTSVTVPAPIQLTTTFPPGSGIPHNQPLVVTWTGGNPGEVVSVQIFSADGTEIGAEFAASAADGQVVIPTVGCLSHQGCSLYLVGIGPVDVVVTHTVTAAAATTFQARGLTLGGWHEWMYQFRFSGLTVD